MKKFLLLFLLCAPFFGQSQPGLWCTNFNDSGIGSLSFTWILDDSSVWEIGHPSKFTFEDSYNDSFSIVTSLTSNYRDNDTSYFLLETERLPHYLGGFEPF